MKNMTEANVEIIIMRSIEKIPAPPNVSDKNGKNARLKFFDWYKRSGLASEH